MTRPPHTLRALGLAALVAAGLAGCERMAGAAREAARNAAAASVDALPGDSVLGQLRADFPQDYARLKARVADAAAAGQGETAVAGLSAHFLRAFYATHEADAERAPAPALLRVNAAEGEVLDAAHAMGDDTCAAFFSTGALPAPSAGTPALTSALTAFGRAHVAAIRAGLDHPSERVVGAHMDKADAVAMVQAAGRYGVSAEQVRDAEQETAANRCRVAIAIHKGIAALPPEQGARIEGFFLHSGFAAGAGEQS